MKVELELENLTETETEKNRSDFQMREAVVVRYPVGPDP